MSATQSHVLRDRRHGAEDRRSPANKRQEGGAHYGLGELQHWDIVALFNLDYFQGNSTKYIFRHRDKNGLEDLKKALHYLEKYMELEYGWTRPGPEPEAPQVNYVDPPAGHNRFLRKAARIGALFAMSAHAFAHCMGITEPEAETLLNEAKAEGNYVPPEKRGYVWRDGSVHEHPHVPFKPEGDGLCGASTTESSEFAPSSTLHEVLEEMSLTAAAAAWDRNLTVEQFAAEQKIEVEAARRLYAEVSRVGPYSDTDA